MPLAIRSLLLDLAGDGRRILAVGERGHILLSEDGGASFEQLPAPIRSTLTAVIWLPDRTAVAVGHDGAILKSAPGGRDWQLLHFASEEERPLLDVWFADAERGLAVGAYGWVMRTTDGGRSWTSGTIDPDEPHLNALAAAADGSLYAAAEFGLVFRAENAAAGFQGLQVPYEGSFFTALVVDRVPLVAGIQGRVYRSRDAGRSWERVATGTRAVLQAGIALRDGRVLLAGHQGVLLIGQDPQSPLRQVRDPARLAIAALLQVENGDILLAGEGGLRRMARVGEPVVIEPVPPVPKR